MKLETINVMVTEELRNTFSIFVMINGKDYEFMYMGKNDEVLLNEGIKGAINIFHNPNSSKIKWRF